MQGKINMKQTLVCAVCAAVALSAVAGQKKYIAFGWEFQRLTPKQILANADKFRGTALDGIGLYPCATNSLGKELKYVSAGEKWEREAFRDQLDDYRKIVRTPHLSESFFVGLGAPVKRLKWTDDAGWANLANSMSVLGWLMRETGVKGMECDVEDYHQQKQFNQLPDDPAWDELLPIVRRRGREVFSALFKEKPDAKVLFFYLMNMNRDYFTTPDPTANARFLKDLTPAFVDGILDAMPETARLINGDEHTYWASASRRDFQKSYMNQRSVNPLLVSPENRDKYRRLTQVSFALYLDMYVNDEKNVWYFGPVDGSRTECLRRNLFAATRITDEYVWLWCEKHPTVAWENATIEPRVSGRGTWADNLPGLDEAMLCCKDSDWGLKRRVEALRSRGELKNLCTNDAPVTITSGESRRMLTIEPVKVGDTFAVFGSMTDGGISSTAFGVDGKYVRSREPVRFLPGAADADGWRPFSGIVVVPADVSQALVLFDAPGKKKDGKTYGMKDLRVYRLW